MDQMKGPLEEFNELIVQKYQIFNALFLSLPFDGMSNSGLKLPVFAKLCEEGIAKGKSPAEIMKKFFGNEEKMRSKEAFDLLFMFLQFIERQVVLFDALEDAAFGNLNDMSGPGTLTHLLRVIKDEGLQDSFSSAVDEHSIRIVLTAHPTQFYPGSVLSILTDLVGAVRNNNLNEAHRLLLQMGRTSFKNSKKPTPLDEAKSLSWYLINVFYHAVPNIQKKLESRITNRNHRAAFKSPAIELGFWAGGDRDGNPHVTWEITRNVGNLLKSHLLRLYEDDLLNVRRRLTFPGVMDKLKDVERRLQDNILYSSLYQLDEAQRNSLTTQRYASSDALLEDLFAIRKILRNDHLDLFGEHLDDLILKIQVFGFYFASIDLRQDSRVIHDITTSFISSLAEKKRGRPQTGLESMKEYADLPIEGQIEALQQILSQPSPAVREQDLGESVVEMLRTLGVAREIQRENGVKGLHRFIISNTQSALPLWEVMALCQLSGWELPGLELDIVPLFETVGDLQVACDIMKSLFTAPLYIEHLKRRNMKQTVMLGFSDGTKDGGYITANWLIYRCKEMLSELSAANGVDIIFFDGRGGPPARGGGNTHKFYRSMSRSVRQKEIHLTVQGQTITSNYGTIRSAQYNLEQLYTAGLEPSLFPEKNHELTPGERSLFDEMSSISHGAYDRFKNHPQFLEYLDQITPLNFYSELNFASRPVRRSGTSLKFSDLRAIPFVGAWTQVKHNIPGYFGIGSCARDFDTREQLGQIRELYRQSEFFRTLLENAIMSLSKSNLDLTRYIQRNKHFADFWGIIEDETLSSVKYLKDITGQDELMQHEPVTRESIRVRERLVLPLTVIQQYALQCLREESAEEKLDSKLKRYYRNLVIKSMAACINAARNSA